MDCTREGTVYIHDSDTPFRLIRDQTRLELKLIVYGPSDNKKFAYSRDLSLA